MGAVTSHPMWTNTHSDTCPVTHARRQAETDPLLTGDVREGVLIELDEGGDDEVENCTCGVIAPLPS